MLESRELYKKTFASQSAAILVLDTGAPPKILEANPAATKIFGYTHDELVGQTPQILHVDEASMKSFLQRIKQSNSLYDFPKPLEHVLKRKNGEVFPSEHTVARLKDEDNMHIGWVSVINDITERKRTEGKLQESLLLLILMS